MATQSVAPPDGGEEAVRQTVRFALVGGGASFAEASTAVAAVETLAVPTAVSTAGLGGAVATGELAAAGAVTAAETGAAIGAVGIGLFPITIAVVAVVGLAALGYYLYKRSKTGSSDAAVPSSPKLVAPCDPANSTVTSSAQPEISPVPVAPVSTEILRYPEQTCSNETRERLRAEKDAICNSIPGGSMSPSKVSPKKLDKVPCSDIQKRIEALKKCLEKRKQIHDECFNKPPDPTAPWYKEAKKRADDHEKQMVGLQNGLGHAEALKKVNCAKGHPMADK